MKPLLSTVGMAIAAKVIYVGLEPIFRSRLSTIAAIGVAALIYGILLLLTKTLTYDDFTLLPKGNKIAALLLKLNLIKRWNKM